MSTARASTKPVSTKAIVVIAVVHALALVFVLVPTKRGTADDRGAAPRAAHEEGRPSSRALGLRVLSTPSESEVRAGISSLRDAAEAGDVEAQVALGRIYLLGAAGSPKDPAQARGWFDRADRAEHPSAAYYRGVMSQSGAGEAADAAAAGRWFEIAAQRGSPHAMFMLANAHRAGAGVPKDDAKAVSLYEKAAEMEHAAALQTLAMAYQNGELGLAPDETEARRYAMEAEHAVKHAAETVP